jgi:hypothetical protein
VGHPSFCLPTIRSVSHPSFCPLTVHTVGHPSWRWQLRWDELSLKALMAYPDVKAVAPFLCIVVQLRQYYLNLVSRHDILSFD